MRWRRSEAAERAKNCGETVRQAASDTRFDGVSAVGIGRECEQVDIRADAVVDDSTH
jgi:hypothetical protein